MQMGIDLYTLEVLSLILCFETKNTIYDTKFKKDLNPDSCYDCDNSDHYHKAFRMFCFA